MTRFAATLFFLILALHLPCQEILFENEISVNSPLLYKWETFPVVNTEYQEISLFLLNNKNINCLRFKQDFELVDTFITTKSKSKYNVLLGHSLNNETYHLFFANANKNRFCVKSIDVANKKDSEFILPIKFKAERFLESISYKNMFYLLSIIKGSSVLKIYAFEGGKLKMTKELDFSDYKFYSIEYPNLYRLFLNDKYAATRVFLKSQKIDNTIPNPIENSSKHFKIYYENDKIYLTFDNSFRNTKIITISLDDFSSKVNFIKQIDVECDVFDIYSSNSYLFNEKLYQVKSCKNELCFRVVDLKTSSLIKEYRTSIDEDISFKNSPFYSVEKTMAYNRNSKKEIKNTKQFIRVLSGDYIGISTRYSSDNIELTIGGISEQQSGGDISISSDGTSMKYPTYNYNPTMHGYKTHMYSKPVYFKVLLDTLSFIHVSEELNSCIYDKILEYRFDIKEFIKSETLFKVDDYYVFGYYDTMKKKLLLIKFQE